MGVFLASLFFSIAVNSITLGLIAIAWLALMLVERGFNVGRTGVDYFFFAYVIVELLASAFSYNPAQSFLFSKRLLLISVVYMMTTFVTAKRIAHRLTVVLLGTAGLVGCLGVLKLIFADKVETTRLGIFQFYMTTAELMMMAGLFLLPFIVHLATPKRIRMAAAFAILPILISLYATVTKGSYLAFAAGAVFIAIMREKRLLIVLAVAIVLVMTFSSPYVQDRLAGIFDLNHPENVSRLMLWKTGMRMLADYPLLGIGDIDMHELYLQYMDPGDPAQHGHFHNMAVQFLVTLGIIGFIVVAVMFVRIWHIEWKIYHQTKDDWFEGSMALAGLAVFVGFQVNGLTEWSFGDQEVVLLFWTSVGMTLATKNYHSREATV